MTSFKFQLVRGDSAPFGGTVTITGDDGVEVPYPITGTMTVRFSAKYSYQDADAQAVFYLESPDRITVIDGPNGVIQFTILPSDYLASFPNPISSAVGLVADLQISDTLATNVYTLARGTLVVAPDVTIAAP
jgi:hypothetical protein